jgi:menaquinone-dependent protoporphyrinogen oxidase
VTTRKPKRVLVTWGSKRGGTAEIARIIAAELRAQGVDVVEAPAEKARLDAVDAVVAGGALYANRWPSGLRRFLMRRVERLRAMPIWLFSSGPLDDSADLGDIPPVQDVAILSERLGARGHATFGGRLAPDAKGFPAAAMARKHAGDWRNFERVRAWAASIAAELPEAVPGLHAEPPARSLPRWLGFGVLGWVLVALTAWVLAALVGPVAAIVGKNVGAAVLFWAVGHRYFAARGARDPLPTAIFWVAVAGVLDLLVIPVRALFGALPGRAVSSFWLPLLLVFFATWSTGAVMAMMPKHRDGRRPGR